MTERAIVPRLLRGATPVCVECHQPILHGEARVAAGRGWRCAGCEYGQAELRGTAPAGDGTGAGKSSNRTEAAT